MEAGVGGAAVTDSGLAVMFLEVVLGMLLVEFAINISGSYVGAGFRVLESVVFEEQGCLSFRQASVQSTCLAEQVGGSTHKIAHQNAAGKRDNVPQLLHRRHWCVMVFTYAEDIEETVDRLGSEDDHVKPDFTLAQGQEARVCPAALQEIHDHGAETNHCEAEHCESEVHECGHGTHPAQPVTLLSMSLLF